MSLIQKTNPVGLDVKIDSFQSYLYSTLGFADWQCYPAIYSVPTSANSEFKGLMPAHFATGVDYEEVYMDDEYDLSTFFYSESNESFDNWISTTTVSLICQVRLDELYPTITHRANTEFNTAVINASQSYSGYETFTLIDVKKEIREVYKEFVTNQIELTNMQPYYVVRFDYRVHYNPNAGC
jgi:hypothetical protein